MKYCKKCNAEYADTMKYCTICGEALIEKISEEKPVVTKVEKKKNGKLKIWILSIAVCAVVICIAFLSDYYSADKKVLRMLSEGEWEAAKEIYKEKVKGDAASEEIVSDTLADILVKKKDEYVNNTAEYEDVTNILKMIGEMGANVSQVPEVKKLVETLKDSREAYSEAESFFAMEDYVEAIRAYKEVASIDENYADAQSKIETCKQNYKQNVLNKAEEYIAGGKYYDAVNVLNNALNVLEGDNDLKTLAVKYRKDEIKGVFQAYEDAGDYLSAVSFGMENLDEISQDPELKSRYESSTNNYLNAVLNQASIAFSEQGYEQAMKVVQEGLVVLKDNLVLMAAYKEYESYTPVNLFDLVLLSGDDWVYEFADKYDNVGNFYEKCYGMFVDWTCFSAEERTYILDKKYSRIEGTVALSENQKNSGGLGLAFYGDGKYLGDTGLLKKGVRPVSFSFDVTGINDLTIVDMNSSGYNQGYLYTDGFWLTK